MNARRDFLTALFRVLELRAVPYCVLRNYHNIYEDPTSDVDLAVEPEEVERCGEALDAAAAASGYRLVHQARYTNHSYVYWHEKEDFLRVDIETEVRWRVFPVLSAQAVIGLRRKHDAFYIPHPGHESVILFLAAIWRGTLSDRYRTQLAGLYAELEDPDELKRTFRFAFGAVGEDLAVWQGRIIDATPDPQIWRKAKAAIIRNVFCDGPNRRALLKYLALDVRRFWERLKRPPGISLLNISSARPADDIDELFRRLEFLYPTQKSVKHVFQVLPKEYPAARLSWKLRLHRLHTLYKGGLFMCLYRLAQDQEIPGVVRTLSRYLYPSRAFFYVQSSNLGTWIGHVKTGFMVELCPTEGASARQHRIIQFITTILPRTAALATKPQPKRGVFVVLLGLDDSGKSSIACNLACLTAGQTLFQRTRYFYRWPRILEDAGFPLPGFGNALRRPDAESNLLRLLLSGPRLLKSLVLTRLAWWLRVAPCLRDNALVVADRYYYDYYLDPASVRFWGPQWLLEKLRCFYPRPDLIVRLKAPAAELRARDPHQPEVNLLHQQTVLNQITLDAQHTLEIDASRPAAEIAETVMGRIVAIASQTADAGAAGRERFPASAVWSPVASRSFGMGDPDARRGVFSLRGAAVGGLVAVLLGAMCLLSVVQLRNSARSIAEDTLPSIASAGAVNASLAESFNNTLQLLLSKVPAERVRLKSEIETASRKTTSYLEAYRETIYSPQDLAQFNELLNRRAEYFGIRERTLDLAEQNKTQEAVALYRAELLPAYHRYKVAGDKLFDYNTREGQSRGQSVLTFCTLTEFAVAGAGILIFATGFLAGRSKPQLSHAIG